METPPSIHKEDPSPVQPQSPPHACLLFPNPGGLHSPFISPLLFILQSSLASCHLREASDLPPTQFPILPKSRPPPPDSITCPHLSPRFYSKPGLYASLSQPVPQARGVDVPHPPRSMLRGRLGDRAPVERPSAAPLGAGQMQEPLWFRQVPLGPLLCLGTEDTGVWTVLGRYQSQRRK